MYIQVRLLKGFQEPLLYSVPEEWPIKPSVGSFVHVPIQKHATTALVEKVFQEKPNTPFSIRPAEALESFPEDAHYQSFIKQLATYYQISPVSLIKRMRQFIEQHEEESIAAQSTEHHEARAITLTHEQSHIVAALQEYIDAPRFQAHLLHGVTGSGKTEVYKKIIEHTLAQNKSAILLLPEVTLATQFERILKKELPSSITLLSFHSAVSAAQKRLLWQTLLSNTPCLIIGVHLPILLPISNLGLIIIDEEHETGYQEKKHPKINSKEAALLRAQLAGIPILLGSATPSLTSLYQVHEKKWLLHSLHKRFAGNFPTIQKVLLDPKKRRSSFWISQELEDAIRKQIEADKQSIIFINRRGFSFFVQCKECSFIFSCSQCSVSLTLHNNGSLHCHYCSLQAPAPSRCTQCKAGEKSLLKKGIGTQQVVTILEKIFPTARIARADLDTTTNKKKWQETMHAMQQGYIDILVGTQTITKGYHFPRVTLVGVLWADLNLHFPVYNAVETTLQQLIQVAGRAGRDSAHSSVIVQTITDHPVFDYVHEVNYLNFYDDEMSMRKLIGYPPYKRLIELECKHQDEGIVMREAQALASHLQAVIKNQGLAETQLLGPAKPAVHKIKNWHMQKLYIKCPNINTAINLYKTINHGAYESSIFYNPNPLN